MIVRLDWRYKRSCRDYCCVSCVNGLETRSTTDLNLLPLRTNLWSARAPPRCPCTLTQHLNITLSLEKRKTFPARQSSVPALHYKLLCVSLHDYRDGLKVVSFRKWTVKSSLATLQLAVVIWQPRSPEAIQNLMYPGICNPNAELRLTPGAQHTVPWWSRLLHFCPAAKLRE